MTDRSFVRLEDFYHAREEWTEEGGGDCFMLYKICSADGSACMLVCVCACFLQDERLRSFSCTYVRHVLPGVYSQHGGKDNGMLDRSVTKQEYTDCKLFNYFIHCPYYQDFLFSRTERSTSQT